MKRNRIIIAIIAFVLIAGGSILIFGQRNDSRFGGFGGRGPGGRGFGGPEMMGRMAEKLNLTDEQKAQAKAIFEDSRTRVQPLMETLRANHEEIAKLGEDGVFNEERVQQLAGVQAETTRQLIIEKEKTKAAVFAILTPEQRVEAAKHKEGFRGGMRKHFPGGPMDE